MYRMYRPQTPLLSLNHTPLYPSPTHHPGCPSPPIPSWATRPTPTMAPPLAGQPPWPTCAVGNPTPPSPPPWPPAVQRRRLVDDPYSVPTGLHPSNTEHHPTNTRSTRPGRGPTAPPTSSCIDHLMQVRLVYSRSRCLKMLDS